MVGLNYYENFSVFAILGGFTDNCWLKYNLVALKLILWYTKYCSNARVAELADALDLGSSGKIPMRVQVPPLAPTSFEKEVGKKTLELMQITRFASRTYFF